MDEDLLIRKAAKPEGHKYKPQAGCWKQYLPEAFFLTLHCGRSHRNPAYGKR